MQATNWRAEQALRPAIVDRKTWGGNRTRAGADTQQVLSSVLATAAKQHAEVLGYVAADIVEDACRRIPLRRDAIGADGLIADPALREQIADVLATLARHVEAEA